MNVALFPSAFHPHFGGVEELSRQLAHELRRRGNTPFILTNRWPKSLPATEEFEGLPIQRYVMRVPERTWRQSMGAALFGRTTLNQMCEDLEQHKADVLHVQCVSSNAYYALRAKRRMKLPLVVTLQGELTMDSSRLFQRSAFARQLLRDALTQADAITACSAKTLADGEEFFGEAFGARGSVIFNGAAVGDFTQVEAPVRSRPYILAVGRLVKQKGFDVLIRAFVQSEIRTHDLLIAGDGTERSSLEELAGALEAGERVQFLGRTDRALTARLFQGCSFFVIPSRSDEGLPVVIAEAMAAGKAIIGTRVGGVPEAVIDGVNGLLIEKEDVSGLSSALQQMECDRELRNRLGSSGSKRSNCFSWPVITGQYEEVYRSVCGVQS